MKRILFSAYATTHLHKKICVELVSILRNNGYQVDDVEQVHAQECASYSLILAFNKKGYKQIKELHPSIPVIYSFAAEDHKEQYLEDSSQYTHALQVLTSRPRVFAEHVTAVTLPYTPLSSSLSNLRQRNIVLGVVDCRSVARAVLILNTMTNCHVDIITSGEWQLGVAPHPNFTLHSPGDGVRALIQQADVVIGNGYVAMSGAGQQKPVVVLGRYGLGGLLTANNFAAQCRTGFAGRLNGVENEYFPLDVLEKTVGAILTFPQFDLEPIALQMKEEKIHNDRTILKMVSSFV